jgi:hypothetical protein
MATVIDADVPPRSNWLLWVGALAGPVFWTSALVQIAGREGFDITRHAISQLSTGDLGWVQVATFCATGVGGLALAAGIRLRLREGVGQRALPVLVALFGAGLVVAGLFTTDPENGFPPGAPAGPVAQMSWHGVIHATAAVASFTALGIAAAVLAVRFARGRRLLPTVLSGTAALVLLLPVSPGPMSIQVAVYGLVAFTWTTVVALWLRRPS